MESFEQEMKNCLAKSNADFTDYSGSPIQLDFRIKLGEGLWFWLEVKEKRQPTKLSNWPDFPATENDVFILDDLSARKILRHAPFSGVAIRNNMTEKYYFIDVTNLFLMPRVRVNRVLNKKGEMKGKWMINTQNAKVCYNCTDILRKVIQYVKEQNNILTHTACYGSFIGEEIPTGGEYRTKQQRVHDYEATR